MLNEKEHKVSFNSNGGSPIDTIKVKDGIVIQEPASPTKKDYHFVGWFSDFALKKSYDFSNVISSDLILYAKWQKNNPDKNNKKNYLWKIILLILLILLILFLLSLIRCNPKEPSIESGNVIEIPIEEEELVEPKIDYRYYLVIKGDTYYKIADKEYSDRHFWPYLYNENKSLHNDPDVLKIGDKLKLPDIKKDSSEYKKYIEYNKEKVIEAFMNSYNAYNDVEKQYRAIRTLASGEIVSEGFLEEIKSQITDNVLNEAEESVERTRILDSQMKN